MRAGVYTLRGVPMGIDTPFGIIVLDRETGRELFEPMTSAADFEAFLSDIVVIAHYEYTHGGDVWDLLGAG